MRYLKAGCGLLCFLILASNVWSMSHWTEARGVYDDVCYLRQAHLFQQHGLGGLDTNIYGMTITICRRNGRRWTCRPGENPLTAALSHRRCR